MSKKTVIEKVVLSQPEMSNGRFPDGVDVLSVSNVGVPNGQWKYTIMRQICEGDESEGGILKISSDDE